MYGSSVFGGSLGKSFKKFTRWSFTKLRIRICSLLIYRALDCRFLGEFISLDALLLAEIFLLASLNPPNSRFYFPISWSIRTTRRTFASTSPY